MTPRWLIAPQEFKGTLTASEAADAIAAGIREAAPEVALDVAPLADGGPGTVEALLAGTDGVRRVCIVSDPLGRPVRAAYAVIDAGRTAVIEAAAASGLSLLAPQELDPLRASSYGTGELMLAALEEGCERLIVGLGGSATNDAGAGALSALGYRFLDADGHPLPPGGAALRRLERVDTSGRHPRLAEVELLAATDVAAPLLGPNGASRLFGPQKGADARAVEVLEAALAHFAQGLGPEFIRVPGAGAAGGLAFGLVVLAGGGITSGYQLVAQALEMERRLALADLVVTGEGRFDRQTALGKGPGALARSARELGKHVTLFAGSIQQEEGLDTSAIHELIDVSASAAPGLPAAEALREAAARWAATARHLPIQLPGLHPGGRATPGRRNR
ncbi:glycerate kinase [Myxococcaceae bacterium GXIMD 01537]